MTLAEFVRLFPLRTKNIAWFFGAGTSVSSGLPTAWDLVWEFKKRIYCSEERYQLSLFNNLSDPAIRNQIQSYFNGKQDYPKENSIEEYSFYFEKAFPLAKDRSKYLMQQLQSMQNSYGHKVLGILMKNSLLKLIFTTNFDKAFENAAIEEFKTMDRFFVATTDNTETSMQRYHSDLRPFIIKMHGDYFSEKLKNTSEELNTQEAKLRDILHHACISNGLAVMGYSGRDASIMEVLYHALEHSTCFPNGIFWFIREGSKPIKEVTDFIEKAKSKNIQAELIEIETFDTAWGEIAKGIPNLPNEDISKLNTNYFKRSSIQLPLKGNKYPIIRFNAIKVAEFPTNARLIKCEAGNTKEIQMQIVKENANLIAIRKQSGIVGFGSDAEFDRVFGSNGKLEKDIYQIPDHTLNYEESTIKGLITESLIKALVRDRPLKDIKRRQRYLIIANPKMLNTPEFNDLMKELNQQLNGTIPKTSLQWVVAIEIQLQKKFSEYIMVISPTVLASRTSLEAERLMIAPFIKEATARWYNGKYPKILDAWLNIFFADQREINVSAFGNIHGGFDANFKLVRESVMTKTL
jgi:NAD-dependent SIR2 family protein deacetylase